MEIQGAVQCGQEIQHSTPHLYLRLSQRNATQFQLLVFQIDVAIELSGERLLEATTRRLSPINLKMKNCFPLCRHRTQNVVDNQDILKIEIEPLSAELRR